MSELNAYFSANRRASDIAEWGNDSFANTCTINFAEQKEKEAQERASQPQTYRELLERQYDLENAKDNIFN